MGFKGAFIMIDQAKQDYIEKILKGTKQMGTLIWYGRRDEPSPRGRKQIPRAVYKRYTKEWSRGNAP